VVRLKSDGTLDNTFGTGGIRTVDFGSSNDQAYSVAVQADGKILVAGYSDKAGTNDFAVVRLKSDGTLDNTFGTGGIRTVDFGSSNDQAYSVAVQADGKILVAGSSINGVNSDFAVVRLNSDGTLNNTFGNGGKLTTDIVSRNDRGKSLTVQTDGKILVAGFSDAWANNDFAVVRLNSDGTLDDTFGNGGKLTTNVSYNGLDDTGHSVAVQDDGKILVVGHTTESLFESHFAVVRYNSDGSLDTTFDSLKITTLDGNLTFVEDGAPVVLDEDVEVFDADFSAIGNFDAATLTLTRNGGANAEDVYSATGTLSALTEGSNLIVDSTTIGTVTTNSGGRLMLTFNSNATNILVNQAMQQIAYRNSSVTPPANIQIDWTFDDGNTGAQGSGGTKQTTGSTTVAITVNNAPNDLAAVATSEGGLSLNEDGGNDAYLIADDGSAVLGGLTSLTFETRYSSTDSTTRQPLVSYATSTNHNEFKIVLQADGRFLFQIGTKQITSSAFDFTSIADGEEHTISFTWQSTDGGWSIYVDGVERDSGSGVYTGGTIAAGGSLVIGQEQNSMDGGYRTEVVLSATLHNTRLFNDVRSAAEIAVYYSSTLPHDESGMIANWTFNHLSTNGVVTDTVAGNNLTINHVGVGGGFTTSTPELTFAINENSVTGTAIGSVAGNDAERQDRIAALLAANPGLVYSAEFNKFYKVSDNTSITWSAAQTAAQGTNLNTVAGQLVTIGSAAENALVLNQLVAPSTVSKWIGATDTTFEGQWFWQDNGTDDELFWVGDDTGSSLGYANWASGEPNSSSSDSGAIMDNSGGTWYDYPISVTIGGYVMEWNADDVLDATDPLTYSIQSQTVAGAFAIDADSGEITVADGALLDFESNATHTITVRVNDIGGLSYDEAFTVALKDLDEPPVNTVPDAQTTAEDIILTFSSANGNQIFISDDHGETPTVIVSVGNGTLTVSGAGSAVVGGDGTAAVTLSGSVANINVALNGLQYNANPDWNGMDVLNVFTTDGGAQQDIDTVQINVTAVNDAPVMTLPGGSMTYTEGDPATVIDASATVSDIDSTDFNTGALIVSFVSGSDSAKDTLAIRNQGMGAGQIGLSGTSDVTFGGVVIGAYTGGSNGADLVIILNGSATSAAAEALVRSITYQNTDSGAPTPDVRTVRFALTDGDGGTSINDTVVDVDGINDAPVLTPRGPLPYSITEDDTNNSGALISWALGSSVTDVDSGAVEGIAITGLTPGMGSGEYSTDGGSSWTEIGAVSDTSALLLRATDRIRFVPDGENADSASFTYRAWDQSGGESAGTKADTSTNGNATAFSTATDTVSITVTAVNDQPTATNLTQTHSYSEGATGVAFDNIVVSDVDTDEQITATLTLANPSTGVLTTSSGNGETYSSGTGIWTVTGTVYQVNAALAMVAFSPASDNDQNTTLAIDIRDGLEAGATPMMGNITLPVTALNDDPWNSGSLPTNIIVTEDIASNVDLSAIDLNDVDAGVGALTVTLTTSTGGNLTAAAGAGISPGGTSTALTLTGTLADLNTYFDDTNNLQYLHSIAHTNGNNANTIQIKINDNGYTGTGGGGDIDLGMVPVNIIPVNDAPHITSNGGGATAAVNAAENQTTITTVTSTDVDGDTPTYTISGGADAASFAIDSNTGSLTFVSAPDHEIPGDVDNNGIYEVQVTAADGNGGSHVQTLNVTVTDVNDAPVAQDDPTNFSANVSALNPIAYWRLGESAGSTAAVDTTGNNHNGTYNGPILGAPGIIPGDTAAQFDGVDDYVHAGNFDIDGSSNGITLTGWFNVDDFSGHHQQTLISKANGSDADDHWWTLSIDRVGYKHWLKLQLKAGGETTTLIATGGYLVPGQEYFAAATYDATSGEMRLYLNGVEVGNTTHSRGGAVDINSSVPVYIGASSNSLYQPFYGQIDEVAVFEQVVTASQIHNLFHVPTNNSYGVREDDSLDVDASQGVLANDSDADGDTLTAALVSGGDPSHGSLNFNGDGSFTYTPDADFHGTDTFTYKVNDGTTDSNVATVTIIVSPVADTPSVTNATTNEDTQTSSGLVISRNSEDGSEVRNFRISNIIGGTLYHNDGTTVIENGDYISASSGNAGLRFTPYSNFNGNGSFDVQASTVADAFGLGGNIATATITVNPVNDNPIARNDGITHALDLNPVAYWRLGESTGSTAVDATNNHNGTYNSPMLGAAGTVIGNTAAEFDGSDDYVNAGVININGTGLTLSAWFNADNFDTHDQRLISRATGTSERSHLWMLSTVEVGGEYRLRLRIGTEDSAWDTTDTLIASSGNLNPGQWYFATATYDVDSGAMKLYLDGVEVGSATHSIGGALDNRDMTTPVYIGANSADGYRVFDGRIDEVAVYDYALADAQIQNLASVAFERYTTSEDNPLVVNASQGVLSNDHDTDSDSLTAVLVSNASNGSVTLNPDGSFTYTPAANFYGTDTFIYKVNDGTADSNIATVTINVSAVNDAPVNSMPSTQTVPEETTTAINGVSISDVDVSGGNLTTRLQVANGVFNVTLSGSATLSAGANNSGDLTIQGNITDINATLASLTYTGNTNTAGTAADTLTVTTNDAGYTGSGGAQQDVDNIQLDVTPINDTPQFANLNDNPTFIENGAAMVLDADVEVFDAKLSTADNFNGALLTLARNGGANTEDTFSASGTLSALTEGGNLIVDSTTIGTVTTNSAGTLMLTFNSTATNALVNQAMQQIAYSNTSDTPSANVQIDWTFDDGNTGLQGSGGALQATGSTTVTIQATNDDPTGTVTISGIVEEDQILTASNTLADADGLGAITYQWQRDGADIIGATNTIYELTDADVGSTIMVVASYTDGQGTAESVTSAPTGAVANVNDQLTATNTNQTKGYTEGDSTVALDAIVVSDIDTGEVITATLTLADPVVGALTAASGNGENYTPGTGVWTVTGSVAQVNTALAAVAFTPASNNDQNTTIGVSIQDGLEDGAIAVTGTINLTVTPVTDLSAADDSFSTNEDVVLNADVSSNDTTTSGRVLSYTLDGNVSHGSLGLNSNGTFTYTPNTNFNGSDSFTYTVTDAASGESDTRSVSITVNPVDDPGTFGGDTSGKGAEDGGAITGTLTFVDTADGDTTPSFTVSTNSTNGSASIDNSTGAWSYSPDANFHGNDNFTVTVTDDDGNTQTQVINITVTQVDDAGTFGGNTSGTGTEDSGAITGTLTFTDTIDGATNPNFTVTGTASDGLASIGNTTGAWSYNPDAHFHGNDSFTVSVTDDDGNTQSQVIAVTVNPATDLTAQDDTFTTNEDVMLNANVSSNDTTTSGGILRYALDTDVSHGTLALQTDGAFTYTPDANYTGSDSFTYTVTDPSSGESSIVTVSITINPVNDNIPVANDATVFLLENAPNGNLVHSVAAFDADSRDTLTYSITTGNDDGVFTINSSTGEIAVFDNSKLNYDTTPYYTLTVQVSDGFHSGTAIITVNVTDVNHIPTVTSITDISVNEYELLNYDISGNFFDIDDNILTYSATLVGGAPLPNWLGFDINTGVFFGIPIDIDLKTFSIEVTARDSHGDEVIGQFSIRVMPHSDHSVNPTVNPPIWIEPSYNDPNLQIPPPITVVLPSGFDRPDPLWIGDESTDTPTRIIGRPPGFIQTSQSDDDDDDHNGLIIIPEIPLEVIDTNRPAPNTEVIEEVVDQETEQVRLDTPTHKATSTLIETPTVLDDAAWQALDTMQEQMDKAARSQTLLISSVKGMTVVVLAGFVRWYLQAGKLLASILATTPLWRQFDPLAVLSLSTQERRKKLAALQQAKTAEEEENEALKRILNAAKTHNHEVDNG
jgi:uncharacterized delta-60 repeat protein